MPQTDPATLPALLASDASLRAIVENVGTNVFVADRDLEIVDMNTKAKSTLQRIESIVRDACGVEVDQLVDMCIDEFHENPSHQRRILGDPRNLPHAAQIPVGPLTLDRHVSAIYDAYGAYVGTVVNREDVTAKKAAEKEAREYAKLINGFSASQATIEFETELLKEIPSAASEQADGISQTNKGVTELDKVTQQNAGNAKELATASRETAAQVASRRELVGRFKVKGGSSSSTASAPGTRPGRSSGDPAKSAMAQQRRSAAEVIPFDGDDDGAFESF